MTSSLVLASTFVAEPIQPVLEYWARQLGTNLSMSFAPYAQIVQQLLDERSLVSTNRGGTTVLLVRCEDWIRACDGSDTELVDRVLRASVDLSEAMRVAAMRLDGPAATIVCLCPPRDEQRRSLLQAAEDALATSLAALPRTSVIRGREVTALYPVDTIYDRVADAGGHIPYTTDYFTALGTYLARSLAAAHRPPVKVLVVDCDNTLWKGVCGELGPLGVEIDRGSAELQQFLLEQSRAGALVCLSSKNVEADVWDVFEHNQGMIVKRTDVVAWRINWRPKSEHLEELARELGLGIDSVAFIDDSPIECAEVRAARPEVLVLELPQDRSYGAFLRHVWELDRVAVTDEDRERTRMYQQERQRDQLRSTALTLDEFLTSMAIEVTVRPAEPADVPRIAQMTKRTNQFNTTTLRETESTVDRWLTDDTRSTLVVHVRDRFGDYGLVGVVGIDWRTDSAVMDRFLLSCRALGRHVEHVVLQQVGEATLARGVATIEIQFTATPKNEPARLFLDSLGAEAPVHAVGLLSYRLSAASAARARANEETRSHLLSTPLETRSHLVSASPRTGALTVAEIRAAMQSITRRPLAEEVALPTTKLEQVLADHWRRALELDTIGIDDDLFELGASSITFVIASSSLSDALDVEIPVSVLLDVSTIAEQASALREAKIV